MIAAAADIALILDEAGVIHDVSIADQSLVDELAGQANWLGKAWADTVTVESRPKVEALVAGAASGKENRWRHVNYPSASGTDVPVLYATVRAGEPGRIVAFGRDLRAVSSLQSRLIDAQQSLERDYVRIRHVETRYRLLFQMASDAVLIVDGATQRVMDSNPTAKRLLAAGAEAGQSKAFLAAFTPETAHSVELLLAGVRASGRADDVRAQLAADKADVLVSASLFRDEGGTACLVRLAAAQPEAAGSAVPKLKAKLLKLMEGAPDGFVVAGVDGRIMTANAAFLELAQLPTEDQAKGEPLNRWLGKSEIDLDILTANLRQHGSVRLFATAMRGELGDTAEVEISAVTVMNGGQPCYGYAIRDVGRRFRPGVDAVMPRSLEHLTGLIGRVALKDLVRESTDVIERLCIEAALKLTGDNRASAAEMLGLSRQSLYVKLRRYGLGDPEAAGAD
ncbi:transcriptional regulator PpsR [Rhodopila globiformis]|uniref:Transcriptional regulator PpsR n=2 Tax=Rhodopila globiformis TaxID=1071 RepID=A0A2S6MZY8_RHOGL|nr:transcriptional regulator PpsR [Rhodopila globiformis]